MLFDVLALGVIRDNGPVNARCCISSQVPEIPPRNAGHTKALVKDFAAILGKERILGRFNLLVVVFVSFF